jgi:hypothetical protein
MEREEISMQMKAEACDREACGSCHLQAKNGGFANITSFKINGVSEERTGLCVRPPWSAAWA